MNGSSKTQVNQSIPYKFFMPVPSDGVIKIYADYLDTTEPTSTQPTWEGTGEALSLLPLSGHDVAGDLWNAFYNGQWVGTSEF